MKSRGRAGWVGPPVNRRRGPKAAIDVILVRSLPSRSLHFLMAERQIDPATPSQNGACPRKRAMKRLLLATLLVAAVGSGYYYRDYFLGTATETRPTRPPSAQPVVADFAAEMSAPIEVAAIGRLRRDHGHRRQQPAPNPAP